MANLGLLNKNAGNIKDPKTGNFQVFKTDQEGVDALKNDLEYKKSGKSAHIKPGGSILDLANVWAPKSDNNIPEDWANNVAKTIGKKSTDSWADIPTDQLIKGIRVAEGTSTPRQIKGESIDVSPMKEIPINNFKPLTQEQYQKAKNAGFSSEQILQNEKRRKGEMTDNSLNQSDSSGFVTTANISDSPKTSTETPTPYTGLGGTNPNDSAYGKIIDNSLTRGIINAVPGAKDLGEGVGSGLAYLYEKGKGLLGGKDNSKYVPEADFGKTVTGATKVMATAGTTALGGLGAQGLLDKAGLSTVSKLLGNSTIIDALPSNLTKEAFLGLGKQEQLNVLGDILKGAQNSSRLGDVEEIAKAIKYLQPDASWLTKFLKGGWSLAKQAALLKVFGDSVGGLLHNVTGK